MAWRAASLPAPDGLAGVTVAVAAGLPLAVMAGRPLAEDALAALFCLALAHDAEVVRRAGSLQFHAARHLCVVHPVQHPLVLHWSDLLVVSDLDAAAHRHQQKEVQRLGPHALGQRQGLLHLMHVVAGNGSVDLVGHAHAAQVFHASNGLVERAWPAEDVVGRGVRSVEADADPPHAALLDAPSHIRVDQRAVGGQGDDQPGIAGVAGDVEDVGSEERLAAGENEDRPGKGGHLVDQAKRLGRGQVLRQKLVGHGDAPAVDAGQVTAGCAFPEDQARILRRMNLSKSE
jgi:hypothetical protein